MRLVGGEIPKLAPLVFCLGGGRMSPKFRSNIKPCVGMWLCVCVWVWVWVDGCGCEVCVDMCLCMGGCGGGCLWRWVFVGRWVDVGVCLGGWVFAGR